MTRTFAYLRVSTEDQNLELQRDAILNACEGAFMIEEKAHQEKMPTGPSSNA